MVFGQALEWPRDRALIEARLKAQQAARASQPPAQSRFVQVVPGPLTITSGQRAQLRAIHAVARARLRTGQTPTITENELLQIAQIVR